MWPPSANNWTSVACVPSSVLNSTVYSATEGDGSGEEAIGTNGALDNTQNAQGTVTFSKFSGETDSTYGPNAFSIQLNTNFFNSGQDWVQFLFQQFPASSQYQACIQQWPGPSPGIPYNNCVAASKQTLSSTYSSYVSGGISTCYNCHDVGVTFCGNGGCVSVAATDQHGLYNNHWYQVDGNIIGAAEDSRAIFASPTTMTIQTKMGQPQVYSPYDGNYVDTGETNNLNYYNIGAPTCPGWSIWYYCQFSFQSKN